MLCFPRVPIDYPVVLHDLRIVRLEPVAEDDEILAIPSGAWDEQAVRAKKMRMFGNLLGSGILAISISMAQLTERRNIHPGSSEGRQLGKRD
jgi:hypothetical protein